MPKNGYLLEYVDEELKNDIEVVLEALKYSQLVYPSISDELKKHLKENTNNTTEEIIQYLENHVLFDKLNKKVKEKLIVKQKKKI